MDLAHLVGAAMTWTTTRWTAPRWMATRWATTLVFFVAGAAYLGVTHLIHDDATPLTVHVPADSTSEEIELLIEEAVLVETGLGLGWRTDPLLLDRAARVAAEAGATDAVAFAESVDLTRRDPLMRARLVERARRARPEPGEPAGADLEALARAPRFQRPATITFEHRYTRDPGRADALLHSDRGEPELLLGARPTRTETELVRALGVDATAKVMSAPANTWTAVRSPLGHHAVRVVTKVAAATPPLDHIRAELRAHWRAERREALARSSFEKLRARFEVELVTLGALP
jgi:hypothetical protein